MNPIITKDIKEVIDAVHYRPAVSLILPFDPKMSLKTEVAHQLKIAVGRAEIEVLKSYPDDLGRLVIQKLNNIIRNLQYDTNKKSIAIYVSPVFEKVLYLDVLVEEKIIVDESFEIRDLVYSKKQSNRYLVLVISRNNSRIFLGNTTDFIKIASSNHEDIEDYQNEAPQKVANFSDMSERKEIVMEKYLRHIDNSLDSLLNTLPLPVFVIGAERITGHFKNITKHATAVVDYIHGNYEEATIPQLREKLSPYLANWKKDKEKDLLDRLEEAANKKKLAIGMKEVWKEAMNNKGRLLVVEKNYMYAAEHGSAENIIYKLDASHNNFLYIKDAVDDVIEKVLQTGGDVEFVEEGLLQNYHRIALIQYF